MQRQNDMHDERYVKQREVQTTRGDLIGWDRDHLNQRLHPRTHLYSSIHHHGRYRREKDYPKGRAGMFFSDVSDYLSKEPHFATTWRIAWCRCSKLILVSFHPDSKKRLSPPPMSILNPLSSWIKSKSRPLKKMRMSCSRCEYSR